MTNYNAWDSKAKALVRDADDDDKQAKADADKALGLEGGPKGPPTAKAEKELGELGEHSADRKEFIDFQKKREVTQTHKTQEEPIVLEGPEVKDLAVRLSGSEGVTYVITEDSGVVKLMFDNCKNVKVRLMAPIITSTIEVYKCANLSFDLEVPIGTFQVDECISPVLVNYAEADHVGQLYHQNAPGLSAGYGGKLEVVGKTGDFQSYTRLVNGALKTDFVRRGEGEFPTDLPGDRAMSTEGYAGYDRAEQPEPEAAPEIEDRKRKAAVRREAGNEMFRASDFLQAAMEYTGALELDPTAAALYANRSVCWLKVGNHEKALEDAVKCTEAEPSYAKGWFRRGMALHAMKKYAEAIPHLLEAEKLEPKNKQIPEAIKMAQLMARREAAGENKQ